MIHFRHHWAVSASRQFVYSDISFGLSLATYEPKTSVLYRCEKCGKYKTKTLNGSWDLAA